MQSGVLSSENVADVLRGISQRRRQGILEVTARELSISIKFVQGRVVEACSGGRTGVQETVAWLERAGYPVSKPDSYTTDSYAQLLEQLSVELKGVFLVSAEQLKSLIKERVLDTLYNLEVGTGAFYTFKVQMVDHDRDFSPSISIGQVLLDLVEMSAERDLFRNRFPPGVFVSPTGAKPSGIEKEDEVILKVIGDGLLLEELERRALLSSFHFMHSLMRLGDASVVSVGGSARRTSATSAGDLDAFLNDSIDAAFAMEPSDDRAEPFGSDGDPPAESLGALVDEEVVTDQGEIAVGRAAYLQSCSAQLLQNAMIPRLIAIGFSLLAVLSPFLAWAKIVSVFAEM